MDSSDSLNGELAAWDALSDEALNRFDRWHDQDWYWTPEWQAKEAEAERDLAAGRYRTFDTMDDMIAFLMGEEDDRMEQLVIWLVALVLLLAVPAYVARRRGWR